MKIETKAAILTVAGGFIIIVAFAVAEVTHVPLGVILIGSLFAVWAVLGISFPHLWGS